MELVILIIIFISDFKKEVDFRYWDMPGGIQPYHWSDGLNAIKIENVGKNDIIFYADTDIVCKVGEITVIKSKQYCGEGLLSPDSVNGDSVF